jgi:2-polyprenyl-3-methyl-5-hydroxy-6-metoxy-1,4-benzoquinol methylase
MKLPESQDIHTAPSVLHHFHTVATSFDSIYSSPRLVDRIFRRDMYMRFQRTLEECRPLTGKSVLDVGCGSGRYAIALAEKGARAVLGVDFAPRMVDLAVDNARRAGVSDRCAFIADQFLTHPFDQPFDYVLAVGFFDYIQDPEPFLSKARELTRVKFIATFPRLFTWRAPARKVRLALKNCPVFFYTRRHVLDLMTRAGFSVSRLEVCGKLYWVSGTPR